MEVNIQKLSESKYLCPLSGKKFKGPEFVRKHILNKHMDKVDACRQEVCVCVCVCVCVRVCVVCMCVCACVSAGVCE